MMAQALQLLSLARKGGLAELGEDAVGGAARARHARLLIVASDAAAHTVRRAENYAQTAACPLVRVDADKQTLGWAVGRSTCALAALTDPGLALRFAQAVGTVPPETLELLAERKARMEDRRREAKAHRNKTKK